MQDRDLSRGKRLDSGEWIYGYYCRISKAGNDKHYIIPSFASAVYGVEVDPATVGQCTGLEDKNGKLIFEGDIVKGHNEYEISDVVYRDGIWILATFFRSLPCAVGARPN